MFWTNIKHKKQRAITKKFKRLELLFLCNALLLKEIYSPMKFHLDSSEFLSYAPDKN